jgi:hypothetical protein
MTSGVFMLVGLSGRLEHSEGEGAAASARGTTRFGKSWSASLARPGEHVDHARLAVGVDLEEELA